MINFRLVICLGLAAPGWLVCQSRRPVLDGRVLHITDDRGCFAVRSDSLNLTADTTRFACGVISVWPKKGTTFDGAQAFIEEFGAKVQEWNSGPNQTVRYIRFQVPVGSEAEAVSRARGSEIVEYANLAIIARAYLY